MLLNGYEGEILTVNSVQVRVDAKLLLEARKLYPTTKGLTFSGLVDFLIRKALTCNNKEKEASA